MDLARAIIAGWQRDASRPPVWEPGVAQGPPSGGWVRVNCTGTIEQVYCPITITPAAGDVVAVLRGAAAAIVIGILALSAGESADLGPRAPDATAAQGVSLFPAQFTWTWQRDTAEGTYPSARRFTGDQSVTQGDTWGGSTPVRHGYWFYNWTVMAALSGATVDAARIRLPRSTSGPDTATVTLAFRDILTVWPDPNGSVSPGPDGPVPAEPGNAGTGVTVLSALIGRQGAAWFDLPADQVQYMLTAQIGPGVYIPPPCIGIVGATNVQLQGVDTDPASGLLEITWHR